MDKPFESAPDNEPSLASGELDSSAMDRETVEEHAAKQAKLDAHVTNVRQEMASDQAEKARLRRRLDRTSPTHWFDRLRRKRHG